MSELKLIAFDYDGVIADSFDHNLSIVNSILKKMGHHKTSSADDIRNLRKMTFAQLGIDLGVPEANAQKLELETASKLIETTDEVDLFPGIPELFRSLSQKYTLAIISNTTSHAIIKLLKQKKIIDHFAVVYGGDHPGSKADKLIELANRYKIQAASLCMVGDAMSDIQAGKMAGAQTAAVTWGFQSEELLRKSNPDYTIHSVQELNKHFTEI